MKKHIKPTQPFGYINFAKSGQVTSHIKTLPYEETSQEESVVGQFASMLQSSKGIKLENVSKLPQDDEDFISKLDNKNITIQLTELTNYNFAEPISLDKKQLSEKEKVLIIQTGKYVIDLDRYGYEYDNALKKCIEKKVNNFHSKPTNGQFWLVVFSTFLFSTEYWQASKKEISQGLQLARDFLRETKNNIYDEIWYFYLETNPVKIYPA